MPTKATWECPSCGRKYRKLPKDGCRTCGVGLLSISGRERQAYRELQSLGTTMTFEEFQQHETEASGDGE